MGLIHCKNLTNDVANIIIIKDVSTLVSHISTALQFHTNVVINEKPIKKIENSTDCSICLEDIKLGEEVPILPCNHIFHTQCIYPWLQKKNICPFCYRVVPRSSSFLPYSHSSYDGVTEVSI